MPATKANTLKLILQTYIASNHHKPHDTIVSTLALLLDPHAQLNISPELVLSIIFSDGSRLDIDDDVEQEAEANPVLWC